MEQRETAPLIPRKVLFGNPDRANPALSPDGTGLAYLAPLDGVLNVWVGPAEDLSSAKPVTHDLGRGIRFFGWAYTNNHIVYIQDKAGDENWRMYAVDLTTEQIRDLTPLEGVQARPQRISPSTPEEIIIGLNDRDPRHHDLYRLNLRSGERRLVQNNEGFAGFVIDDDYNVRFAMRLTHDGGSELLKPASQQAGEASGVTDWGPFIKIGFEDSLTTSPLGFDKTGSILYMFDSRSRDTAALTAVNLETGEERVLAENPQADVSGLMIHPTEKHVQAVAFTHLRKRWHVLDESISPDLAYLGSLSEGDVEVISRTLDDKYWIVSYAVDDGPIKYYRYSREEKKAEFLFTNRVELEGVSLAKMHPVVINSRDRLDLLSYCSLPVGSNGDGGPRPDRPMPTVLLVHGGPFGRDDWGYHPQHQLLANRGYAVLSVNFRGSTGIGKGFTNAANGEWGGKMHDDLVDAVRWAIQEGIADPQRLAIMGGSYGGYATLVGVTFTPDLFACGVDIVGPSNLVTLLESIPPYWQPQVEMFANRVGDHRTEQGRKFLGERSPLNYVERISKPLLIGQGANDPRVKQAESDQIVGAMREKNIPVAYVLYPDEGHGFARPENNLSFYAVAEAFLARCLGGRYQPVGEDFQGSSITVPAGAEQVPGLEEALLSSGRVVAEEPL